MILREEAEAAARATGDEGLLARCKLARIEQQIQSDSTATMADAHVAAQEAFAELEQLGDEEGAIWALRLIGNFTAWLGSSAEALVYWRRAMERAERASPRFVNDVLSWTLWASWWGPMTADESIRLCDETLAASRSKRLEAHGLIMRGSAKGALDRLDEGREDIAAGRGLSRDLGDRIWWAGSCMVEAEMELMAGNADRAYAAVAEGHEVLAASAETGYLATVVGVRAQAALALGRDDEALQRADEARAMAQPDDFEPRARERFVRAQVLARRGDFAGADELISAAPALVDPTDYVILHLDLAFARAEVARLAGRANEERAALERALSVAEAKGRVVAAERAREGLSALDGGGTHE